MKTTLDIEDELLARAKRHARKTGRPLRALVEDGLRHVRQPSPTSPRYTLRDLGAGNPGAPDPLERYAWPELRELIYSDRGSV